MSVRGVLLVKGSPLEVEAWVRRGVVAAHVVPAAPWVAVVPAESQTRVPEPYDAVVPALAGHPLRRGMRPGLGFFVLRDDSGERALVTLQSGHIRTRTQWLSWTAERGTHTLPPLPAPSILDLAKAVGHPEGKGRVLDALRARRANADEWLTGVMLSLGISASDLILGRPRGAAVIEPEDKSLGDFTSLTANDLREEKTP